MALDHAELDLVQEPRAVENFRRHVDFTQVVDDAGHPDSLDLVLRQAQLLRDRPRQVGDPFLVAGRVRIARFHGERHRLDESGHGLPQGGEISADAVFLDVDFLKEFGRLQGAGQDVGKQGDQMQVFRFKRKHGESD